MREHSEHVFIVHSLYIVNVFILFVHLLITMNIYIRLPITVNNAVVYYSATPCSICTSESDRNTLLGKSNNFIFRKTCLLVVPAGFDPRFNIT